MVYNAETWTENTTRTQQVGCGKQHLPRAIGLVNFEALDDEHSEAVSSMRDESCPEARVLDTSER